MSHLEDEANRLAAAALAGIRAAIARDSTIRHFQAHPELDTRYGAHGRAKCSEDAEHHLLNLEQAIAAGRPELFVDYVRWAVSVLQSRGLPQADLLDHLRSIVAVLPEQLPREHATTAQRIAAAPLQDLAAGAGADDPAGGHALALLEAVRLGGAQAGSEQVDQFLRSGMDLRALYVDVVQPCLYEIGRLWQLNYISVADEHYLTAAIQVALAGTYPALFMRKSTRATVVIACVPGELHEIGARMVADLLQLEGFDSHFLGASTPVRDLVAFVAAKGAAVIGLSATITPHLARIEETVRALRLEPATRAVRIVVGGRPFLRTPELWRTTGADACATDARDAVRVFGALAG